MIGERAAGSGTDITDPNGDWYGSISWDTATGQATFPRQRSIESHAAVTGGGGGEGSVQTLGTCSLGRVSDSGSNIEVYFTDAGLAIVATQVGLSDQSHIIGVPQVAISTASDHYGNYSGFIFDEENGSTFPVSGTFGTGTGTAGDVDVTVLTGDDLDGTGASYSMRFNSGDVDSIAPGFMTGQFSSCTGGSLTGNDGTCEISCAVSSDVNSTGRTFIYCVGQHPDDEDDRMTVLLVSQ